NGTLNTWWDLTGATPRQLPAFDASSTVVELGDHGVILRKGNELSLWDGKKQTSLGPISGGSVAITPDARTLVHADATGKLVDVFMLETNGSRKKVTTLQASPYFLKIRPDGKAILAGEKAGALRLFQLETGGWQETWQTAAYVDAAFAAGADRFALCTAT